MNGIHTSAVAVCHGRFRFLLAARLFARNRTPYDSPLDCATMHETEKRYIITPPRCGNGHRFVPMPHGPGIRFACLRCLTAAIGRGGAFRASILGTLCHYMNMHEKNTCPKHESPEWARATDALIGWMNRRDDFFRGNLALGCEPGVVDKSGRWIPKTWNPNHGGEITPEIIRAAARHVANAAGLHFNQTAVMPLARFAEVLDSIHSGFCE